MKYLIRSFSVYMNRRMAVIFLLGLCSGLPNALITGTLAIWLREEGLSRTSIGIVGLTGLAYAINFLWAPLLDRVRLPLVGRIGQRRSWAILVQTGLIFAIWLLVAQDPVTGLGGFVLAVALIAFLSASQDVVIDAYRIEYLKPDEYAAGAAMTTLGWLTGAQVVAGFVILHLVAGIDFAGAYALIALVLLVGPITLLLAGEPVRGAAARETLDAFADSAGRYLDRFAWMGARLRGALGWLYVAVAAPFLDFMKRPEWYLILAFVVLFKLGDAMLGRMTGLLYVDLGFSPADIANYSKLLGLGAFLVGAVIGGAMARLWGTMQALLMSGIATTLTNLLYAWLASAGQDYTLFAFAIVADNMTTGMVTATFVAYLSSLCNVAFTATQYALLASLANFAQRTFAASAGAIVDYFETLSWTAALGGAWSTFFFMTVILALPGIGLLLWLMRHYPQPKPHTAGKPDAGGRDASG